MQCKKDKYNITATIDRAKLHNHDARNIPALHGQHPKKILTFKFNPLLHVNYDNNCQQIKDSFIFLMFGTEAKW